MRQSRQGEQLHGSTDSVSQNCAYVSWEALPSDFVLPDDPVENIQQPPPCCGSDRCPGSRCLHPTRDYEQILQVPTYVTYDPYEPSLEVRCLEANHYVTQAANAEGRFWIPELNLWLGMWLGDRLGQRINWLRWWDEAGNVLLWSAEQPEQERQRAEILAAKLCELGVDPEQLI